MNETIGFSIKMVLIRRLQDVRNMNNIFLSHLSRKRLTQTICSCAVFLIDNWVVKLPPKRFNYFDCDIRPLRVAKLDNI